MKILNFVITLIKLKLEPLKLKFYIFNVKRSGAIISKNVRINKYSYVNKNTVISNNVNIVKLTIDGHGKVFIGQYYILLMKL